MFKTTLDQWLVFKTIIEKEGYSAAAEALNRSQSTVSYSMAKLQSQLDLKLIQVEGKNCKLTAVGCNLLQRVYPLLDDFEYQEKTINFLADGVEAKIKLNIDNIFPKDVLFSAIHRFSEKFPLTEVHVDEQLRLLPSDDADFDLAISASEAGLIPGAKLLEVSLIPVAHRDHPIFQSKNKTVTLEQLSRYKQIFYQRVENLSPETIPSVPRKIWSVRSVEAAIAAVKSNLCYGWLPKHAVGELTASGVVKPILVEQEPKCDIPLYLVEKDSKVKGPATCYLVDMIKQYSAGYN